MGRNEYIKRRDVQTNPLFADDDDQPLDKVKKWAASGRVRKILLAIVVLLILIRVHAWFNRRLDDLYDYDTINRPALRKRPRVGSLTPLLQPQFLKEPNLDDPPRIAQCIMGDARTFYLPEVYQNFGAHLLLPLNASVETFFIGSNGNNMHNFKFTMKPRSIYDDALRYVDPVGVFWTDPKAPDYNAFADYAAGDRSSCSMYDMWPLCEEAVLAREAQYGNTFRFDHVIRSRPDFTFLKDFPSYDRILATKPNEVGLMPYYEVAGEIPSDPLDASKKWEAGASGVPGMAVSDVFLFFPRHLLHYFMNINWEDKLPVRTACEYQADICECRIKAVCLKYKLHCQAWPIVGKIRRGFEFCKQRGVWNHFNTIC